MTAEPTPDARVEAERGASDAEREVLWCFLSGDVVPSHTDFEAALWGACTAMLMLRSDAVQREGLTERVAEVLDREMVRAQHNASAGWDNEIVARAVVAAIYGEGA